MLSFFKMHGLGNDYIFIDNMTNQYKYNFKKLSKKLCDRHFSVGGDGIIVLEQSKKCDVKMQIYNSDGSTAKVCGNATRCVAFYIYQKYNKKNIIIQSASKILTAKIKKVKNNKAFVEVNMGKCFYKGKLKTNIGGKIVTCNIASIGNKHCIIFVDNYDFNIDKMGKAINKLEEFKNGINVEFVKVNNINNIEVKVYERGSGVTLACGSGACASSYVCYCLQKINKNMPVFVNLDGGQLNIKINKNNLIMSGECEFVCKGEINWL